jgi:mycothiol synthase
VGGIEVVRGLVDDAVRRQIRGLASLAETADGVAPLSEAPRLALDAGDPGWRHFLVWDELDLVGYAVADPWFAGVEFVVAPAARRRGIGRALACAVTRVAGEVTSGGGADSPRGETTDRRVAGSGSEGSADPQVPGLGPGVVTAWAYGDLPGAIGLAGALGARRVRELVVMRLAPIPGFRAAGSAPGTDGWVPRPFVPGSDNGAWLGLNAAAFVSHPEQGSLTSTDLDRRLAQPWFHPGDLILAEAVGPASAAGTAGYVWTKIDPPGGTTGEIYAIGVHPGAQGRGLGGLLMDAGLRHLARRGARDVVLYVEGDNAAALHLYRRLGFDIGVTHAQYTWE